MCVSLLQQIVNEYTDWERTVQHPMNTRDACVQALSDAQFVAPLVQTGDLFTLRHTKRPNGLHGPLPVHDADKEPLPKTYFYVFDYQMKDGDYPQVSTPVYFFFIFGECHDKIVFFFVYIIRSLNNQFYCPIA